MIQLRQLDPILFECDQVPLSAGAPPFPLEEVQNGLTESFGLRGGELSLEPPVWRESGKGLIGLGADPILLPISCTPLDAPLFWAMGPKELSKVMALFLDGKEAAAALEESLSRSFLNFLMAEVMELLERADYPSSSLTFTLSEESPLPDEPMLTIDVQWAAERRKVKGRLLIPTSFHRELQSYFANQRSIRPSKELLESLSIPVQWEAGETTLSFEEWQRTKPGDLILLDRFDRDHLVVSARGIPLATAVAEANGFRIEKFGSKRSFQRMENGEEIIEETPHSPSSIPVTIKVVIGEVEMSVERLLEMQPGNLIELGNSIEGGVSLVVNGRRVGRGELLQVGDHLGVRLLELI